MWRRVFSFFRSFAPVNLVHGRKSAMHIRDVSSAMHIRDVSDEYNRLVSALSSDPNLHLIIYETDLENALVRPDRNKVEMALKKAAPVPMLLCSVGNAAIRRHSPWPGRQKERLQRLCANPPPSSWPGSVTCGPATDLGACLR